MLKYPLDQYATRIDHRAQRHAVALQLAAQFGDRALEIHVRDLVLRRQGIARLFHQGFLGCEMLLYVVVEEAEQPHDLCLTGPLRTGFAEPVVVVEQLLVLVVDLVVADRKACMPFNLHPSTPW